MSLEVSLQGVGLYGPGLPGWSHARPVLAGQMPWEMAQLQLPTPMALPPAERRRVGLALKLALAVGFDAVAQASADATQLAAVFSSTGGDCDNCHQILTTLASADRSLSPTRFHNSVHNMPAGYWGIATGCMQPCTSLCAYDATFSAALLEAATQIHASERSCLLIAYDTAYPDPLGRLRRVDFAFGVAMVLAPADQGPVRFRIGLNQGPVDRVADERLEPLRLGAPSGRSLPLLERVARQQAGRVVLDYLEGLNMWVDVSL